MLDHAKMLQMLEKGQERREERRRFIKLAATGVAATGGLSVLAACDDNNGSPTPTPTPTPTPAPTATTAQVDIDVLNFALNLEYLEATFYLFATTGNGLPNSLVNGTGTLGSVTGGRQVAFADSTVATYAREIAADELAHVIFLRNTLSSAAIAQPALNIDGISATGAFTVLARAAGIVSSTGFFDPYASDDNFLLAGFIFEDVGATAYKGSATLIQNKTYLEAAAGILAVEGYHAGLIRTLLYRRGLTNSDRTIAAQISALRDTVDGSTTAAGPPQVYASDDQGVSPTTINGGSAANITPTDVNGIVFGRPAANVLNVVYGTKASVTSGGFFPAGVNGNIKASAAN